MTTINIADLDKAEVLAALFNASRQQGMGFMHGEGRAPMTAAEARDLLKHEDYFDYLRGRVMKIAIEDELRVALYDRDNGQGAAERAIAPLRSAKTSHFVSPPRAIESSFSPPAAWPFPIIPAPVESTPEPEHAYVSGGGGDFGGGGASSSWSDSSSSSSSSDSSSSGSSDSGSCSSSSD